jgi:hypothetical protein
MLKVKATVEWKVDLNLMFNIISFGLSLYAVFK